MSQYVSINIRDLLFHPEDRDSLFLRHINIVPPNYKVSRFYTEGDHRLPRNTGTNLLNYTASYLEKTEISVLLQYVDNSLPKYTAS
jgi:hypothetical protein